MTTTPRGRNRRVAVALAGVLGAQGVFGAVAAVEVTQLLGNLDPPLDPATASWLATLVSGDTAPETLGVPPGPAQRQEGELAPAWLALYLVAAAERLSRAMDQGAERFDQAKEAEERYFALHLRAERRRQHAAALQDVAQRLNADRPGGLDMLLGWRAVLDDATTPECRWAHGRNFKADRMPVIGWPGAVHLHCRCSAGPPVPGAALIPAV